MMNSTYEAWMIDLALSLTPPPPRTDPFPDRLGFANEPLTIQEALAVRRTAGQFSTWTSGTVVGPTVGAYDDKWMGSSRNSMTGPN